MIDTFASGFREAINPGLLGFFSGLLFLAFLLFAVSCAIVAILERKIR